MILFLCQAFEVVDRDRPKTPLRPACDGERLQGENEAQGAWINRMDDGQVNAMLRNGPAQIFSPTRVEDE